MMTITKAAIIPNMVTTMVITAANPAITRRVAATKVDTMTIIMARKVTQTKDTMKMNTRDTKVMGAMKAIIHTIPIMAKKVAIPVAKNMASVAANIRKSIELFSQQFTLSNITTTANGTTAEMPKAIDLLLTISTSVNPLQHLSEISELNHAVRCYFITLSLMLITSLLVLIPVTKNKIKTNI